MYKSPDPPKKRRPSGGITTVNSLLRESQTEGQFPIRIVDLAGLCVNFYSSSDPNKAMEYARIIQRNSDQPLTDFVDKATVTRLRADAVFIGRTHFCTTNLGIW